MTFLLSVWISNREKILRAGYQMQKCKILFASQTPIFAPAEVDSLENRVSLNKLNVHSLAVRGRRQSIKWQYISSRFEYCQHASLSLPWLYILYNHYWSQSHSPPLLNLKTGPSWALVDGSWPLSKQCRTLAIFISTVGALSRPSYRDNHPTQPIPSTYRFECS